MNKPVHDDSTSKDVKEDDWEVYQDKQEKLLVEAMIKERRNVLDYMYVRADVFLETAKLADSMSEKDELVKRAKRDTMKMAEGIKEEVSVCLAFVIYGKGTMRGTQLIGECGTVVHLPHEDHLAWVKKFGGK